MPIEVTLSEEKSQEFDMARHTLLFIPSGTTVHPAKGNPWSHVTGTFNEKIAKLADKRVRFSGIGTLRLKESNGMGAPIPTDDGRRSPTANPGNHVPFSPKTQKGNGKRA